MWRIEYDPGQHLLMVRLAREVREVDMRALARAHAQALEATGNQSFYVLADLRGLFPLDGEAAAIFSDMKRVAAKQRGYRGRAVLVDSATIAMQQRNATLEDGGDAAELITMDEDEARRFVR
ncbi:MAG: hypothetical protein M5U28_35350 [Sandaracinaceae bacterium]|nr:hypothetical protein [Sandaracinaceae bacterium]